MPNHSHNDGVGALAGLCCCSLPPTIEARTIEIGRDRRAFARQNLRAGRVLLRNAPTAHCVLREHRSERCALCLSTTRRRFEPKSSNSKLLRCGGCRKTWYCSRECQERDFFVHSVECKQASILLEPDHRTGSNSSSSNTAALLVRNFCALRVPRTRSGETTTTNQSRDDGCHQQSSSDGVGAVCCGSSHFQDLLARKRPLDNDEISEVRAAANALWNQRGTASLRGHTKNNNKNNSVLPHSVSALEELLAADLRRFAVNNFGVADAMLTVVASGVYPLGALLNHSCAPNCVLRYTLSAPGKAPAMEVVAARDIAKGEELTHSYVELVSPRESRRKALRGSYGFDCHCTRCSSNSSSSSSNIPRSVAADGEGVRIPLPETHRSMSQIQLTRWVLQNYNPQFRRAGVNDDPSRVWVDPDILLRALSFDERDGDRWATAEAGRHKQREAQWCMRNGDLDGELAALNEVVRLFEAALAAEATAESSNPPLSLDLYKARCDRLGTLIVAGGNIRSEEALIECQHVVAFLCMTLDRVPNHSLLGLQLFTLGDLYDANGNMNQARSTYIWAREVLRVSHGTDSKMFLALNEKIEK